MLRKIIYHLLDSLTRSIFTFSYQKLKWHKVHSAIGLLIFCFFPGFSDAYCVDGIHTSSNDIAYMIWSNNGKNKDYNSSYSAETIQQIQQIQQMMAQDKRIIIDRQLRRLAKIFVAGIMPENDGAIIKTEKEDIEKRLNEEKYLYWKTFIRILKNIDSSALTTNMNSQRHLAAIAKSISILKDILLCRQSQKVNNLTSSLNNAIKEIQDKDKEIQDKDKEIQNQKKVIQNQYKEIQNQKKVIQNQDKVIQNQYKEIQDQSKKIEELSTPPAPAVVAPIPVPLELQSQEQNVDAILRRYTRQRNATLNQIEKNALIKYIQNVIICCWKHNRIMMRSVIEHVSKLYGIDPLVVLAEAQGILSANKRQPPVPDDCKFRDTENRNVIDRLLGPFVVYVIQNILMPSLSNADDIIEYSQNTMVAPNYRKFVSDILREIHKHKTRMEILYASSDSLQ